MNKCSHKSSIVCSSIKNKIFSKAAEIVGLEIHRLKREKCYQSYSSYFSVTIYLVNKS